MDLTDFETQKINLTKIKEMNNKGNIITEMILNQIAKEL